MKFRTLILRFFLIVGLFLPYQTFAVMNSSHYSIYSDSIGLGGGSLSTSTSFNLQDTANDSPAGVSTSTGYEVRGGYQAQDLSRLSIDINPTSLDLGSVTASVLASASTIVSVTSDSASGYTLAIGSVSGSMPAAVAIGATVTAGTEGYGFSATGPDNLISGDKAVVAGTVLASSNGATSGSSEALIFKVARSAASNIATYTQAITFTASANF